MKIVQQVKIKNALGLHMRPAAFIIKLLHDSLSSVFFTYKNETINARSITSILMLGAKKDAEIAIEAEGEDAEKTMHLLVKAFEQGLGEGDGAQ